MSEGNSSAGIFSFVGDFVFGLGSVAINAHRRAAARRGVRDIAQAVQQAEQREIERRRAALDAVRRQMARGAAGDATAAQMDAADRNPLDERYFR